MGKFVEIANQTFKLIFDTDDLDKIFVTKCFIRKDSIELIEGEILERREIIENEFVESKRIALVLQKHLVNLLESNPSV
ncbi:MAG: hypothetical protein HC846_12500 [Blastocatellia bacterium]|nr:hypothetical protein [Blastocatellia bacterium]